MTEAMEDYYYLQKYQLITLLSNIYISILFTSPPYFFIRDILLATSIGLSYRYIANPNFSMLADLALRFIFTSGVAIWYIRKYGYGEFTLQKKTVMLVMVSLLLTFSIPFLMKSLIVNSGGIFGYQFLTISWAEISGTSLVIHAGKYPIINAVFDTVILAPIFESALWLGLFQKPLYKKLSPYKAIAITTAVFALSHWSLVKIPYAFTSGLLYGYLYYKTGRLIYPILCHSFNNLLATFLVYTSGEINAESAVTLLVIVACFVVSLRYVLRYRVKEAEPCVAEGSEVAQK
jgi:membrane protease YdiL (CAAX protease family)